MDARIQRHREQRVSPNLPAGMGPIPVDYVELLFAVPES